MASYSSLREDSPTFRRDLRELEKLHLDGLSADVDRLRQSGQYTANAAQEFATGCAALAEAVSALSPSAASPGEESRRRVAGSLTSSLLELNTIFKSLAGHIARVFGQFTNESIGNSLSTATELRRLLAKSEKEYLTKEDKYLAATNDDDALLTQAENNRLTFEMARLDYSSQLQKISRMRSIELAEVLLTCTHTVGGHFQQCVDALSPSVATVDETMPKLQTSREQVMSDVEEDTQTKKVVYEELRFVRHANLIGPGSSSSDRRRRAASAAVPGKRQGILRVAITSAEATKRKREKAMKSVKRMWVSVGPAPESAVAGDGASRVVIEATDGVSAEPEVFAANLLTCTVRSKPENVDRRYFFEARSEREKQEWVSAITAAIQEVHQRGDRPSTPSASGEESEEGFDVLAWAQPLRSLPGNSSCADCGAARPQWASISLGVIVCLECSGIHRSLGVHISQVRSLAMDHCAPCVGSFLSACGGNENINTELWEYEGAAARALKPTELADRSRKERYIREKYVSRTFCPEDALGDEDVDEVLREYVLQNEVLGCVMAVCAGAKVNESVIKWARAPVSDFLTAVMTGGIEKGSKSGSERAAAAEAAAAAQRAAAAAAAAKPVASPAKDLQSDSDSTPPHTPSDDSSDVVSKPEVATGSSDCVQTAAVDDETGTEDLDQADAEVRATPAAAEPINEETREESDEAGSTEERAQKKEAEPVPKNAASGIVDSPRPATVASRPLTGSSHLSGSTSGSVGSSAASLSSSAPASESSAASSLPETSSSKPTSKVKFDDNIDVCVSFLQTGKCKFGDNCVFQHTAPPS